MSRTIAGCVAAMFLLILAAPCGAEPEKADAAESIKKIKEFPSKAREELKQLQESYDASKKTSKELAVKIAAYRGTDDMSKEVLTDESNGFATIKGYEILLKEANEKSVKYETAIKSVVEEIKKGQKAYKDANGALDEKGEIPADVQFEVTKANGNKIKLTLAEAKKLTKDLAGMLTKSLNLSAKYEYRRDRLTELVVKLESTQVSLKKLLDVMSGKLEELQTLIDEIEAELKLIDVEKEHEAINKAIEGKGDNSLGKLIAKCSRQSDSIKEDASGAAEVLKPKESATKLKQKEVKDVDHEDYWK